MSKDDNDNDNDNIIDFITEKEKKDSGDELAGDQPDDYFQYITEDLLLVEVVREEFYRLRRAVNLSLEKSHNMIMLNFAMLFLNLIIFMSYIIIS